MAVDREFMYIGSAGPGPGGRTDGRAEGRTEGGQAAGRGRTPDFQQKNTVGF